VFETAIFPSKDSGMKHLNTVLHQLLKYIPRYRFDRAVERHGGDHRIRTLNCWTQFVALIYAQLAQRVSLRDLQTAFNSHATCHFHLGATLIRRSTLADANAQRAPGLFFEIMFWLIHKLQGNLSSANEIVRLIDSTTLDLNLHHYAWAKFRSTKAGIKLHTVYDPHACIPTFFEMGEARAHDAKAAASLPLLTGATYVFDRAYHNYEWYARLTKQNIRFVGRMKANTVFEVISSQQVDGRVSADETIRLTSNAGSQYPECLRRILYTTEEGKKLVFITNDFERPAQAIADLYKMRWQIELFFKWIKQNLKIKRFLGTSKNAVLIQVTVAIIAYLLVRLVQQSFPNSLSMQQWARLICVNIFDRKQLESLAEPPPNPANTPSTQQLDLGFA
jgi:hypothetical protein